VALLVPEPLVVFGKLVFERRSKPSYSKVVRLFSPSYSVASMPLAL
jgi:hypothetical protein